jgi:hypothetical protein
MSNGMKPAGIVISKEVRGLFKNDCSAALQNDRLESDQRFERLEPFERFEQIESDGDLT